MKIKPPAMRQNDVTISVGGREGIAEFGGEINNRIYVAALAKPAYERS